MRSYAPLRMVLRLMIQQPEMTWLLARNLIRKHVTVELDYRLGKGFSKNPRQISLKITNRCNLRCKMCAQWGEAGYNLGKPAEEVNKVVPLDVYRGMVDEVAPVKPIFYVWGGEPFLYPDMVPLLEYLKSRRLITTIVTNGLYLSDNAEKLVAMELDGLLVSLDGVEEIHNRVRGSDNNFRQLMDGLSQIREERLKRGSHLPYIAVLITISSDNMGHLTETFEEAARAGADAVICYYSWFTNPEIGHRHVAVMEEHFGITPTAWEGYLLPYNEIDGELVAQQVREISQRSWPFPYMFLPQLDINDIPRYYQDPAETFKYNRCVAPWLITEIMPNGDVVMCRDYPDYVLGNITDESILNIWNNPRSRQFRSTLKDCKLFPICSRCCGLMGF